MEKPCPCYKCKNRRKNNLDTDKKCWSCHSFDGLNEHSCVKCEAKLLLCNSCKDHRFCTKCGYFCCDCVDDCDYCGELDCINCNRCSECEEHLCKKCAVCDANVCLCDGKSYTECVECEAIVCYETCFTYIKSNHICLNCIFAIGEVDDKIKELENTITQLNTRIEELECSPDPGPKYLAAQKEFNLLK